MEVDLPRAVRRELRQQVRGQQRAEKVMLALTLGAHAIDEQAPGEALAYLRWAKHQAPRSAAVREALGVALYLQEDYAAAASELQAYRRLSDATDQNHLIADCLRASGRESGRIGELVDAMDPERDGRERYVEGVIVWASALADAGDPGAGTAVLRRVLDTAPQPPQEADLRAWYVAGDLAERAGDATAARSWWEAILDAVDEFHDTRERLEQLDQPG